MPTNCCSVLFIIKDITVEAIADKIKNKFMKQKLYLFLLVFLCKLEIAIRAARIA